jgi:hypothetical protein
MLMLSGQSCPDSLTELSPSLKGFKLVSDVSLPSAPRRLAAQGLVEYALIIALVAVLAIAGLVIFGPAVSALLSNLGGSV